MISQIIQEDLDFICAANLPWSQLNNRTVLISGANGFLPAYMVETLLNLNRTNDMNIEVIGLVRDRQKAQKRFSEYQNDKHLHFLVQDVCAPVQYDEKIDIIVHAASQASPKYFGSDPVGTLKANVLGTYNLLELARIKHINTFLYFSSGEVYGQVPEDRIPTPEDFFGFIDPTNVRSCYAESKRIAETMCVSWAYQFGVNAKIVRPFHTYGPGMALDDGRVFADFVSDIVNKRNIIMKSDGLARRAFCYLADATIGFFTVLLKGENNQAYNVGNDKGETSIIDLAHLLVSLFPELGLQVIQRPGEKQTGYLQSKIVRNCPSIEKIMKLGWQPYFSIAEGFHRTIRSFL